MSLEKLHSLWKRGGNFQPKKWLEYISVNRTGKNCRSLIINENFNGRALVPDERKKRTHLIVKNGAIPVRIYEKEVNSR